MPRTLPQGDRCATHCTGQGLAGLGSPLRPLHLQRRAAPRLCSLHTFLYIHIVQPFFARSRLSFFLTFSHSLPCFCAPNERSLHRNSLLDSLEYPLKEPKMRFSTAAAVALAAAPAIVSAAKGSMGFALGTKEANGDCKTQSDYEADFDAIKEASGATIVRGYAAADCNMTKAILPAAEKKGFKVVLGIWYAALPPLCPYVRPTASEYVLIPTQARRRRVLQQ